MNTIKIVATPEAYSLLTDPAQAEGTQLAINSAVKIALRRRETKTPSVIIAGSPLYLSLQWSNSPDEDSFILVHSKREVYFLDKNKLYQAIKTALPLSLV